MEIRCDHKKHGEIVDGFLEVSCCSTFCGKAPGVVVLHRFDVETGELVDTLKYRDPSRDTLKGGKE